MIQHVNFTDTCWEWDGQRDKDGYGRIQLGGRKHQAHRLMYELFFMRPREGYVVMLTCDNTACCNPAHMRAVPHSVTVSERDRKGRGPRGERNGRSMLSAEDVMSIRDEYIPYVVTAKMLARKYGVSRLTIKDIVDGTTWKHLL